MSPVSMERDPRIAEALSNIAVPEHRPTFWADLHRRLDAEITIVPDQPIGASVTSIAPAKLPPRPAGATRLETGELPSVRSLAHEHGRRRSRAPWLAIAAGLVVLAGAMAVVTFTDNPRDDAQVADAPTPTDAESASTDGTDVATETTAGTVTSTSFPTTVLPTNPTPDATVRAWLTGLAEGDTAAAAALLGPRSIAYLQSIGGDPVGVMAEAQEGFGAWPDAADLQMVSAPLGVAAPLGAELAVVSISGTYPGEGGGSFRVDAVPVVQDPAGWRIEQFAHQAGRDDRLVFTVPALADDGTLGTMAADAEINVFAPTAGTVYFILDGTAPVAKPTTPVGRNDDPFALHNPGPPLAPGPHQLVVVAVGDDGTITTFAGTFVVEG